MSKPTYRRRKKLIQARLQLRLTAIFLGVSVVGMVLQALLIGWRLSDLATGLPTGGSAVAEEVPGLVMGTLAVSLLVLLPVTLLVGVVSTFRIAGPLYRFEQHLKAITRGEEVGPLPHPQGRPAPGSSAACSNRAIDAMREERATEAGGRRAGARRRLSARPVSGSAPSARRRRP